MRGMVSGTETLPDNRLAISGQAPLKEIQGYHSRLKSLTGGDGSFDMDFSHYAEVAPDVANLSRLDS
jgi:elongation factor G